MEQPEIRECGCPRTKANKRHLESCTASPKVLATKCRHTDRRNYAQGLCVNCYHSAHRRKQIKADPRPYQRASRTYRFKKRYGITPEAYDALFKAQSGVCAICQQPCVTERRLAVDHDHATGKVRGLLCMPCNRAIALFHEDPTILEQASIYLRLTG